MLQQPLFTFEPAAITGERAVRAYHTMARHDDANRVLAVGQPDGALGDLTAAEAYYRRAVVESKTSSERLEALLRVATCLMDQGREALAEEITSASERGARWACLPNWRMNDCRQAESFDVHDVSLSR